MVKQSVETPAPSRGNAQVTISWNATDPNGPPLMKYTVYRDGTPIATVSATAQPTTSDTAATRRDILRQLTDSGTVLAGAHVGPLPSPPVAPRDEPR